MSHIKTLSSLSLPPFAFFFYLLSETSRHQLVGLFLKTYWVTPWLIARKPFAKKAKAGGFDERNCGQVRHISSGNKHAAGNQLACFCSGESAAQIGRTRTPLQKHLQPNFSPLFGTQGRGCACVTGAVQLKGTIYISDKARVECSLGIALERRVVRFAAEPLIAGDTFPTFTFTSSLGWNTYVKTY